MTTTDPIDSGAAGEDWVDIRMTDPEKGEWSVDEVTVNGEVQFLDLRIRSDLISSFVECLLDDVGPERASEILATVAERRGVELAPVVEA
ncbi:MAG: hypothetical protein ABEJ31_02865 [Haloarculaceae archaeon]